MSRRAAMRLGFVAVAGGAVLSERLWLPRVHETVLGLGERAGELQFNGSGGVKDDSAALDAAIAQFEAAPDGTRLIIRNKVRYAKPGGVKHPGIRGGAAILVRGGNNKTIEFDESAELIMDNLKDGLGTSHGIAWLGAGQGNSLIAPHVRWAQMPVKRGLGDGIRIVGYPSDDKPEKGWTYTTGTMRNFRLLDWSVENAPQTGAILMGCTDPVVGGGVVTSTKADGLHFNACRRPVVVGHTSTDTGDDGLAFVTYFDTKTVVKGASGPFNQPSLGSWSNHGANATRIAISGGRADGVRVSGALDVTVRGLTVRNKSRSGVIIDSALANDIYKWTYEASRGVLMSAVDVSGCSDGVTIAAQNVTLASQSSFWDFDTDVTSATVADSNGASFVVATPPDLLKKLPNVRFPIGSAVAYRTIP